MKQPEPVPFAPARNSKKRDPILYAIFSDLQAHRGRIVPLQDALLWLNSSADSEPSEAYLSLVQQANPGALLGEPPPAPAACGALLERAEEVSFLPARSGQSGKKPLAPVLCRLPID